MPEVFSDSLYSPTSPRLVTVEFNEFKDKSVILPSDLKIEFFGKSSSTENFVAVKPIGSELLSNFIIYKVSNQVTYESNRIIVNDNSLFRGQLDITIEKALVTKTEPITLSKVIVALPPDHYKLLKGQKGETLFNFLNTQLGIDLIHEGDPLLGGKVLLCDPIDQGLISKDSVITLIKDESQKVLDGLAGDIDDIELNFPSFISKSTNEIKEFPVKALNERIHHTILNLGFKEDSDHVIYASNHTISKIGCFSGDFVEIVIDETTTKVVKLLAFIEPNTFQNEIIYASPLLVINSGYPKTIKIKPTTKTFGSLPLADSLTVERVLSPNSLSAIFQNSIFGNLKTFLDSKLTILSKGDLIPVTFDSKLAKTISSLPEDENFKIPSGAPDTVVWFKILNIDDQDSDKEYLVDTSIIRLHQSGSIDEKPPPNTYELDWVGYLGLPKAFQFNSEKTFPYASKISKLLNSSTLHKNLKTSILLKSLTRNVGKQFIIENLSTQLGLNYITIECYDILNSTNETKTIGSIRGKLDRLVGECSNLVVFFKHIEALAVKQDDQQSGNKPGLIVSKLVEIIDEYTSSGAIFVASSNDADKIPEEIRSNFRFEIEIPVPSEDERNLIFEYLLSKNNKDFKIRNDVSLSTLSLQSAGLTPRDLISIFNNTKYLAFERLEDFSIETGIDLSRLILNNPITLTPDDFEKSINDARNKFSDSIGAPRIPNVTWDDIGGLDMVKGEILDTIDMPLKHPELFNNGVKKRSGILFYGPPGTGKTLLAKAIATNFSLNFFSVKGPELLNMYIGESEANVRKVFQRARDAKPCVVFFDELDSVAPKRGNQGDSGGVMDRIVSQLLAELDGMSSGDGNGEGVFVVGATNRPDLLDEALLRPGRFDKMLYLGISDTHDKQTKILEALTRKFKLDEDVILNEISEQCPFNYTGADFYALCSDSMLNAMTRVANEIDVKLSKFNKDREDPVSSRWWFDNIATDEDIKVLVKQQDFLKAKKELSPSVSQDELNHYLRVRQNFEGNKTKK
ncbi:hypothetical protein WICMUC_003466 [Wickerhamomyces mucosus]|uniref:Peroxisomal ATPase PEX6 n=1 Tax=Wickerhamomyces mucosus TaxID=1378264 RepID=A0A9P8TD04_9ASCO|nr:hypothetical protein WICMUC_003466 [Wickerhamomyces mucosus]